MEKIDHAEADSEKEGGGSAKVSLLIIRKQMILHESYGICYSAIESAGAIEGTWTAVTRNLRINP